MPLRGEDFSSDVLGRLYEALRSRLRAGQSVSMAVLGERFSQEELSLLAEIIHRDDIVPAAAGEAMGDYIRTIQEEKEKATREEDLRGYAEKLKQRKGYGGKDGS